MPRKIYARPCACGCGEIAKSGLFAPGHDQKVRARVERALEDAGYPVGVLAVEEIVTAHLRRAGGRRP